MTFLETMTALAANLRAGAVGSMHVRDNIEDHQTKAFMHRLSVVMNDTGRQIGDLLSSAPAHIKDRLAAVEIAA
jgi:hypothetical protein